MNLQTILLLGAVFLFVASLVALIYLTWRESRFAEKMAIKKRLLFISAGGSHGEETLNRYKDKVLKETGVLGRFFWSLPRVKSLDQLLINADIPLNASTFMLLTIGLGLMGGIGGWYLVPNTLAPLALGALFFISPFAGLRFLANRSLSNFEEQLPEALDLLTRALRSGHALSSGLKMVAEEMENPIRSEFSALVDELNLGLSLKEALTNLTERVPSQDLRFFTIATLIQKETGGNITEIFDNLSRLIRERLQFRRQVRALTAEGRLSGWILVCLPFLMFLYIYFANYEYISLLWTDEAGKVMLVGGVVLMVLGIFAIRRIVRIEI